MGSGFDADLVCCLKENRFTAQRSDVTQNIQTKTKNI